MICKQRRQLKILLNEENNTLEQEVLRESVKNIQKVVGKNVNESEEQC